MDKQKNFVCPLFLDSFCNGEAERFPETDSILTRTIFACAKNSRTQKNAGSLSSKRIMFFQFRLDKDEKSVYNDSRIFPWGSSRHVDSWFKSTAWWRFRPPGLNEMTRLMYRAFLYMGLFFPEKRREYEVLHRRSNGHPARTVCQ